MPFLSMTFVSLCAAFLELSLLDRGGIFPDAFADKPFGPALHGKTTVGQ